MSPKQKEFLQRLETEESFGIVRHMTAGQIRTGHSLVAKGLVELDGFISSGITEGSSSFNGYTFVPKE